MPSEPEINSHSHSYLLNQCKTDLERVVLLAYIHHLSAQTAYEVVQEKSPDEMSYNRVAEIYRAYKLLDTPKLSLEQLVKAMVENASVV